MLAIGLSSTAVGDLLLRTEGRRSSSASLQSPVAGSILAGALVERLRWAFLGGRLFA